MAQNNPSQSRNVPKYGAWSGNSQISGLTPPAPIFPKTQIDPAEIVLRNRIEEFQREQFDGFTSRELADMDVITDRHLKDSTLNNPIMPLFQQQRWEIKPHQPDLTRDHMYPLIIDGVQRGDWSMHNPLVYEKMKPVLQLASRTITSMYTLPWFAALIFGKRVPIDPARIRSRDEVPDNLVSFLPYNITDYSFVRKRMKEVFEDLEETWNCKFGFMSPDEDPRGPEYPIDPEDTLPDSVYGLTVTNYQYMEYHEAENKKWQIYVWLAYSRLQSLFRNDLTTLERKMVEWASAITLVHEIVHAINFVCPRVDGTSVDNPDDENPPWFFDQEPLAEAGFSFEVALNGGTVRSFTTVRGMPYGHWFETVWPSVESQDLCGSKSITLMNPGPFDYQERFPIPASFYEDMQQREFWDYMVHRFGHKLFHYRSINHGVRLSFDIYKHNRTPIKFRDLSTIRIGPVSHQLGQNNQVLRERWESVHTIIGAQGEPEERKIAQSFGMSLLQSSKVENSFWTHEEAQRRGVAAIFEHLKKQSVSEEERFSDITHLIGFIWTIVQHHKSKIDALLKSGQAVIPQIQIPSEERRRALLTWNRGTSIFVKQCSQQFPNASEGHKFQLSTLGLSLEILRLQLFSPNLQTETIKSGPDFMELALLLRLQDFFHKGDMIPCRDIVKRIREIDGCSLFANMCVVWMETTIYEGSETDLDRVKSLGVFEVMGTWWRELWEKSSGGEWEGMFRIWEGVRVEAERRVMGAHHM